LITKLAVEHQLVLPANAVEGKYQQARFDGALFGDTRLAHSLINFIQGALPLGDSRTSAPALSDIEQTDGCQISSQIGGPEFDPRNSTGSGSGPEVVAFFVKVP
jgi:hypothetical protein